MCLRSSLPSYSFKSVKVGLVMVSSIPKPSAIPLVKAVFPTPKSPDRTITHPFSSPCAKLSPSLRVSFILFVSYLFILI